MAALEDYETSDEIIEDKNEKVLISESEYCEFMAWKEREKMKVRKTLLKINQRRKLKEAKMQARMEVKMHKKELQNARRKLKEAKRQARVEMLKQNEELQKARLQNMELQNPPMYYNYPPEYYWYY